MHKKSTFKEHAKRLLLVIVGAALVSVGLEIFLIPNKVIDGGVVGISIMGSYLTGLPLGAFTLILNLPFVVIGYRQIGKTFALITIYANILLSIGVSFLHPIPGITNDILLAAVFGGVFIGVGVGLIIRNGGSLDGTEIVAIILDKRSPFSIGEIIMFFNLFILSSAGFVFGWDRAMYSLITYFIAYKTIDITVEGLEETKGVFIVSEHHADIVAAIRDRLGRDVTALQSSAKGKGSPACVIHVIVTRLEIAKLKSIVDGFDENALMTIGSVEVHGKRYKKKAIH